MNNPRRLSTRTFSFLSALVMLIAGLTGTAAAQESAEGQTFTSSKGHFTVRYRSALQPIDINQIHHWVLQVETADGEAVSDATIEVEGGMPEHDHGLATSPQISAGSEAGDYLLDGLRFHMPGYWELTLSIKAGSVSDTVLIPLHL